MTTLKAARADLAAQITTAVGDPSVAVLAFDPPSVSGDTVTVSTAGIGPVDWQLYVRVYVDAVQSLEGQARLDDLAEAVDLGITPPRSEWTWRFDEVKQAFIFQATVDYPREDWG
jgi:hypothetical protein